MTIGAADRNVVNSSSSKGGHEKARKNERRSGIHDKPVDEEVVRINLVNRLKNGVVLPEDKPLIK